MNTIRILSSLVLIFIAYKHALLWGRFFMNLHGMKSPVEVSMAYLRPNSRFIFFFLPQASTLAAIWALWPYGHWGLTAIIFSAWLFKAGMRCELLRTFVRMFLHNLDSGLQLEEAWIKAESTVRAISNIRFPNINRHATDPGALIQYVVATTRNSHEASEIGERWIKWVKTQSNPPSDKTSTSDRRGFSDD